MNLQRILCVLSLFACAFAPATANAQALQNTQSPSYATATNGETISGTVTRVNGKFRISVLDARGFIDDVTLHPGTIINPTGLTLAPGEPVTIAGSAAGTTFIADRIDTPYVATSPLYGLSSYSDFGLGFGFGGPRFGFGFRR